MTTERRSITWTRVILAGALATATGIAITASGSQAALDDTTPFEIDENTVVNSGTDWLGEFAAGNVSVANDTNFTGAAVVQSDVGSADTEPSWLADCPGSNSDSTFKPSTGIDDPDWTGDDAVQSVTKKNDICQSYFSFDVIEAGPDTGDIVAYLAFTRRVFNGDGSFYFVLSKGPNPDVRVDGDVVIEVGYNGQGDAQTFEYSLWQGSPTPTLSAPIAADAQFIEASPVKYFAEVAVNLTALGLAPNVFEIDTPEECGAFGYGRAISRTGNSANATLKDDGEPAPLDFNLCGSLEIVKQLTSSVPGDSSFAVDVTAPAGVTLGNVQPSLAVTGGATSSASFDYPNVPPRLDEGYNVWEDLATQGLDAAWDLDSITCVNDSGTDGTGDDVSTPITGPSDTFLVGLNEHVTCTVVNSPAPAIINVDKLAGDNDGTWPVTLTGPVGGSADVTDDGTNDFVSGGTFETFGQVPAGTYTLTEGDEAGNGAFRADGWSCTTVGGGTVESDGASIEVSPGPGEVVNCTVTNVPVAPPDVRLDKTATPTSFNEPAGSVTYDVTIYNDGDEPFDIQSLDDLVTLNPGAVESSNFDLGTAVNGDGAGISAGVISANSCGGLIGTTVAGGGSTSCSFDVDYTGLDANDIIDDTVTVTVVDEFGRTDEADDDAQVNVNDVLPVISVTKTANPTSVPESGDDVTFTVVVENDTAEAVTTTSLTDNQFGNLVGLDGSNCVVGQVLQPSDGNPGSGPDTYTCTFVQFVASDGIDLAHENVVTAIAEDDDGNQDDDEDNAIVDFVLLPDTSVDKTIDGSASLDAETGVWTIVYDVTVTNEGRGGATYDLDDEILFGDGVVVESVEVSTVDGDTPNADFDGGTGVNGGNTFIVNGASIDGTNAEPVTETYTVTVTATIPTPVDGAGACDPEGVENGGFLNTVTLSTNGEPGPTSFDCDPFSSLTLVKVLDNGDGGNATLADFVLTATDGDTTYVEGTDTVTAAVPAGTYDLAETQQPGYSTDGFDCDSDMEGASVSVGEASDVTCTIVNDDEPVDLEITKDDGGFTATAGEQVPFDYTITFSNNGPRELDDEPVEVVDELPIAFEWVAAPEGCTIDGQTLTCDIDPAELRPVGTEVVIVAQAQVAEGAQAGGYDNQVTITTEDDPVGDVPPCSNEDAVGANNNVDCEPILVESALTIDVLSPVCVNDAPFIEYNIGAVGFVPTGDATLTFYDLDGNFIETRTLTSLSGTTIYPGASVDSEGNPTDWPGWKFEGGVWVPDPTDNAWRDGVLAVFEVNPTASEVVTYPPATEACADPTQVSADLQIIKTASVAQVGAGGGFDWVLDITNNGPDDATDVVIADSVPGSVTVVGVSSSDFDCGNVGNTVTCTVDTLAVGASGTVTIAVTVPANAPASTVTNVGTVDATTPDPDPSNNSDDASVTIVAQAPPAAPPPPAPELPATGSDITTTLLQVALMMLLLGGAVVLSSRRRPSTDDR